MPKVECAAEKVASSDLQTLVLTYHLCICLLFIIPTFISPEKVFHHSDLD